MNKLDENLCANEHAVSTCHSLQSFDDTPPKREISIFQKVFQVQPNIHLTEVSLGLGLNLVRLVPRGHVLRKAVVEGELLSTDGAAVG